MAVRLSSLPEAEPLDRPDLIFRLLLGIVCGQNMLMIPNVLRAVALVASTFRAVPEIHLRVSKVRLPANNAPMANFRALPLLGQAP